MTHCGSSFIVEGAISVGKTTTLHALQEIREDWAVHAEPVKSWECFDVGLGEPVNLLANFYQRKDGDSFRKLQFAAMFTIGKRYVEPREPAANQAIHVYERSMRVAREVFLRNSAHLIDATDFVLLEGTSAIWEEFLERGFPSIYLTCREETMLRRLKLRNRTSENNMSEEYALEIKRRMDDFATFHELQSIDTSDISPTQVAHKIIEWHNFIST